MRWSVAERMTNLIHIPLINEFLEKYAKPEQQLNGLYTHSSSEPVSASSPKSSNATNGLPKKHLTYFLKDTPDSHGLRLKLFQWTLKEDGLQDSTAEEFASQEIMWGNVDIYVCLDTSKMEKL